METTQRIKTDTLKRLDELKIMKRGVSFDKCINILIDNYEKHKN